MNITTWSFSKRKNSTKQPTGSGSVKTCVLKEPTSLIRPTFKVNSFSRADNYLQWDNRYYFIEDIVQITNDVAEYQCIVDPLASWKTEIGTSSEYVLRAASLYDNHIIDSLYPCKGGITTDSILLNTFHSNMVSRPGFYVVGIMGAGSTNSNAIQYYMLTAAEMRNFVSYLFSNDVLDQNETDYSFATQKLLINPSQYIVSCRWFPMAYDAGAGTSQAITAGWWTLASTSGLLMRDQDRDYVVAETLTLSQHPDAGPRGLYLNGEPYTRRTLHIYNFGDIDLPASLFIDNQSFTVDLSVDLWSGVGLLVLYGGGSVITQRVVNVGVEVPISNMGGFVAPAAQAAATNYDWFSGWVSESLSPVSDALSKASNLFSNVLNGVAALMAKPSVTGSQATDGAYQNTPRVSSWYSRPVNEDIAQLGRPLCQVKQINSLSGYILCSGAEVDLPCTEYEREQIDAYLNSGFYYE